MPIDSNMEADRRIEISRLALSLAGVAADFPWRDDPVPQSDWQNIWWWWNLGFVRAAERLTRSIVLLSDNGFDDEASGPLRSLLELVANQGYMAEEPQTRAPEFIAADLNDRDRGIRGLRRLGAFSEEALNDIAATAAKVRDEWEPVLKDVEDVDNVRPFGRKAEIRIRAAGMSWHYQGLYTISSDYVHMGARAVTDYLAADQGERVRRNTGSKVIIAAEILLRCLYFADLALERGRRDFLDGYAIEYSRIALPERPRREVINNLWPPTVRR
jgi:uncharacterized protein DUF5677